jgi:hypothetical protein
MTSSTRPSPSKSSATPSATPSPSTSTFASEWWTFGSPSPVPNRYSMSGMSPPGLLVWNFG